MKFIDIIRMAGGNLRRNLLRSFLTISGVVIGIGAIVFLVSLGFGLQELATSKVANLDALTTLTVNPSNKEGTILNQNAIEKFKNINGVTDVSPIISFPSQTSVEGNENGGDVVLYGIIPEFFPIEDIVPDFGHKNFSSPDSKEVIVSIASLKSLNLTDPNKALNQELNFKLVQVDEKGNQKKGSDELIKLKVIGITKEENTKYAYTPLKNMGSTDNKAFNTVRIKTAKRDDMAEVKKAVESMGFPTSSVKDTVDQINQIFSIIKGILFGFGMVALFVAEIGIFNTLTISLLERTHEIGIMKAIGGRDRDVARIFTMEAMLIGLIGGLAGVSVGWLLGFGINSLINFIAVSVGGTANKLFHTPAGFAGFIIGISFVVSTIAGLWPAKRAAKLDPLEALRYE